MTVKEKRGRRRYVAFTVDRTLTKEIIIEKLKKLSAAPPYVVQCAEGWAIVRCSPDNVAATISMMKLADPSSASLRTSGTLASLRDAYPELKRLRPVKRM